MLIIKRWCLSCVMDEVDHAEVIELVKRGYTYEIISEIFKSNYPHVKRGLSSRSIRRFCKDNNVKKLDEEEVDEIVEGAVTEV